MKKTMLLAMGLSAFIASTTTQTFAQAHSHFVKIPPTVEEISAEIGKQQTSLAAIVAKKTWVARTIMPSPFATS